MLVQEMNYGLGQDGSIGSIGLDKKNKETTKNEKVVKFDNRGRRFEGSRIGFGKIKFDAASSKR
ncbi:unnamed protein product [Sphenostylis stenocarpa]|uniref:Uncharacterized protein n=1 Tax=Sphenostylis stenocarpa TaxID=92480 RepID=A0AA86VBG5_9FABA|nr:unnamed protein product [Sphenostylis stenocarpa]